MFKKKKKNSQCPEKFAQSLLLFVKGLGFLTSLQLPGITHGGKEKFNNDCYMIFIVKISDLYYIKGDTPPSKSSLAAIGRRRTLSMEEYVSY